MSIIEYAENQRNALGERIEEVRIARGYNTQKEFSIIYSGNSLKTTFISQLEKGKNIKFDTFVRLIIKLEVSPVSLCDFKNKFPLTKHAWNISEKALSQKLLKVLAKRIKAIRKEKGQVQVDVELDSLIGDGKISRYELSLEKPEFDTISRIAYGLNVEVWELFWNGEKEKKK